MTIGELELVPEFDKEVLEYTVSTSNASNKVTASTDDPSAVITILLNNSEEEDKEIENGKSVTWASGENVLTITVTDGEGDEEEETIYTVTVTKIE